MAKNHHRNELEIEAGCRLAEIGGMAAGVGDGYQHVKYWMETCGVDVPPCRDGVAQDGSLDRLGRPLQRGRGLGLFDDIWPVPVVAGVIVEMIPVNFKGSKSDPYGNRDLTSGKWDHNNNCPKAKTPLAAFFAAVDAGTPIWVCLLTEQDGKLMMRRADAARVWTECQGLTVKGKPVCHLRVTGSGAYKGLYRRVRIEWRHVPAEMWLDADWLPFDPTSPLPLPVIG
jgi:hypothetical protein